MFSLTCYRCRGSRGVHFVKSMYGKKYLCDQHHNLLGYAERPEDKNAKWPKERLSRICMCAGGNLIRWWY